MKRILLSSIVGAAIAISSFGGMAQAAAAQPTQAAQALVVEQRGPGGKHKQGAQQLLTVSLMRATAKETGLSMQDLADQLKAGKSLAQIAQAKGKSADTIIATVRTELKNRLDKAVANKRTTQERANEALAAFDKNAPTVMNDTTLGQKIDERQERREKGAAMGLLIRATSEVTGLTPQQIKTELKAGKSLAQIAQSKGKTANDILAKAKELADEREQELLKNAADLVNQTNPADTQP